MKVAIFGESFLPYLSGVTISTDTLARELNAQGHEVLLVVPAPRRPSDRQPIERASDGVQFAWLPSFQVPGGPDGYRAPWPWPSRALNAVAAFQPDIVHAQSPFTSGLMARLIARRARQPLVFTHHTRFADYAHYAGPLRGPAGAVSTEWLRTWWRGCQAVIAPSADLAAEIRRALGDRPRPLVRVIPTGVDVAGIAATPEGHPRRESGWPPGSLVAVSVGRVATEKNVELVVRAFAVAAEAEPRLHLLLVGGGPAADRVGQLAAELGVAGRVSVTGRRTHVEAMLHLRASDLFVFASQTETQGLVLAEALAAGVPVVALSGPGVGDTVRAGVDGVVVPAEPAETQAERLAAGILTLAQHPRRRARFAAQARAGAVRFDRARRVVEVVELYAEALGEPR